jgi:hypothetical protein
VAGQELEAQLERRRRITLKVAAMTLAAGVLSWPIGGAIGAMGGEWESVGGAFFWLGIIGLVAAPWIVLAWQRTMARRMLDALVAGVPEIRHVFGEEDAAGARLALAGSGCDLGLFQSSGLVEPFDGARVLHVLAGRSGAVPFALAEANLLQGENGYRVFGGVVGSFRLPWSRPGLTLVRRDRGLVGNLVARAGSGIERVALEDPSFEGVFEAYGTDQVLARTILTTTMLERLQALDEHAHARGFMCAFTGDRLLIALPGMRWRCPAWRLLLPLGSWLDGYRQWLIGLIELPAAIATTLKLERAGPAQATAPVPAPAGGPISLNPTETVFSLGPFRLLGEVGMRLIYIASGTLFGGLAAVVAWYGLSQGYSIAQHWQIALMVLLGLAYGVFAVSRGVIELVRFFWGWKAPLRGLNRAR